MAKSPQTRAVIRVCRDLLEVLPEPATISEMAHRGILRIGAKAKTNDDAMSVSSALLEYYDKFEDGTGDLFRAHLDFYRAVYSRES